MTTLTGFDEALAVVIARRRDGVACPWTGETAPPLPTDADEARRLAERALAAPPSLRRRAVLALLGVREASRPVVQLTLWSEEPRRAA